MSKQTDPIPARVEKGKKNNIPYLLLLQVVRYKTLKSNKQS